MKNRCNWVSTNQLMIEYHDNEWGVPVHDDRKLFEFMVLDAFQAGLSWAIILNKRTGFHSAFDHFDPKRIADYSQEKIDQLILNPEIIRNRLKIHATVNNAQRFLEIQKEFGSFEKYIWQFVGGKPFVNRWKSMSEIPTSSTESDTMSKDLKLHGFKFVGTTICYAFMQAAGLVNDHMVDCFRYREVYQ